MFQPVASARIRWLTLAEGGRHKQPSGPNYAATAHFQDGMELFSVVLKFEGSSNQNGIQKDVELTLLAPDKLPDIVARLVPSSRLVITEGSRPVAECDILAVQMKDVQECQSKSVS